MINIPGSTFINPTPQHGKYFKRGVVYKLRNIKKLKDAVEYVFDSSIGKSTIVFESTSQADNFLSKFKVN